jgi:5-methylcytosine-specific restriction endonuclease McrA
MSTSKLKQRRADEIGQHRVAFDKNKRRLYQTENVCGICGQPIDKSLRFPHPMSKCIDHIIPISRGGHPSDMANLQIAHLSCNRQKSDKIAVADIGEEPAEVMNNRNLPWTIDWRNYRAET